MIQFRLLASFPFLSPLTLEAQQANSTSWAATGLIWGFLSDCLPNVSQQWEALVGSKRPKSPSEVSAALMQVEWPKQGWWWACLASCWSSALSPHSFGGGSFFSFLIRHWLYTARCTSHKSTVHWIFPFVYTQVNPTQIWDISSPPEGFLIPTPSLSPSKATILTFKPID